jgi:predicted O-methyltransferase YrrM
MMYGNIKKYLGGIIVDDKTKIKNAKYELYNNNFADNKFEKNISIIKLQYKNSVTEYDNCYHGWLANSTKLNLKFVIDKIKPKNIVELGSWYGLSASYMIKMLLKSNFYFFDKFQNICLSPYIIDKFNVLNKFYFTYSRMETFYKNIMDCNSSGNIYACRMNALNSIEFLKKYNIEIDLIFIDFLKKTHELLDFLNVCIINYPNAVIVGDDYVFDTVKYAIVKFSKMHNNKYNIYVLPESYIISKIELDGHDKIFEKTKKDKPENKYNQVKKLIENNEFDLAFDKITEYDLDMNDKVFGNNNTLYHILAKVLFQINKKDIIHKFEIYQKPEKIENMLLLTYDDYLNYNVNFS